MVRPLNCKKAFDWYWLFGIIAAVALAGAGPALAQQKPAGGKRGDKAKVVEQQEGDEEAGDEEEEGIVIAVKIPKPEALIFERPMELKYNSIGYEKSFTDEIIDSAKRSPF